MILGAMLAGVSQGKQVLGDSLDKEWLQNPLHEQKQNNKDVLRRPG